LQYPVTPAAERFAASATFPSHATEEAFDSVSNPQLLRSMTNPNLAVKPTRRPMKNKTGTNTRGAGAPSTGVAASLAAVGSAGLLVVLIVSALGASAASGPEFTTTACGWPYYAPGCPDYQDPPACTACQCPPGSGGASPNTGAPDAPGSGGAGCPGRYKAAQGSTGMPVWWVSEPYINLRLEDEPLGYQPPRGPRVACQLSYRQRGALLEDTNVFGVGANWSCSFRAYVANISGSQYLLHRGGAGVVVYTEGVTQPRDGSILNAITNGYQIAYADGSVDSFQLLYVNSAQKSLYFLSLRSDPAGNSLRFNYFISATGVLQLTNVVDPDGRTTKLSYTNTAFTNLITQVTAPFSRTAHFQYHTNGYLTNIVDVATNSSSLTYDAAGTGWITTLTTPYGNTGFRYGGVDSGSNTFYTGGTGQVDRKRVS
jgi:hypothetical protein